MPDVPSHGIRIRYDDQGQGEPALLFLPGWCASRRVFAELAALFPPDGLPDMQAVIALAQRYNLEFDMSQLPVIIREHNVQLG
ncbi:alpha/beta fold hydrolase [Rhodothermus bifroesti]|uniref:Uncharacterized protein n=1 Tax=Rhodothermus marinus TaxID=29549 RepID=A0A7V2B1Y4_RHOMR|nr:hypothetical protein [Rhodothermus bifroesti]GBD00433.1 hypothetical protein HRbin18_00140 [bacterium HR18]